MIRPKHCRLPHRKSREQALRQRLKFRIREDDLQIASLSFFIPPPFPAHFLCAIIKLVRTFCTLVRFLISNRRIANDSPKI